MPKVLSVIARWQAERFRIPVDTSYNLQRAWIVALDQESKRPTTIELALMRAYQRYIIGRIYRPFVQDNLLNMRLPAIGGHNTATFKKEGRDQWLYNRLTWSEGPHWAPWDKMKRPEAQGLSLSALLDYVVRVGSHLEPRWIAFKEASLRNVA